MGELEAIDWDLVKKSLLLMVVGGMVIYSMYNISVVKEHKNIWNDGGYRMNKKQIIYVILWEYLLFI